jgi:hypothetical protein
MEGCIILKCILIILEVWIGISWPRREMNLTVSKQTGSFRATDRLFHGAGHVFPTYTFVWALATEGEIISKTRSSGKN